MLIHLGPVELEARAVLGFNPGSWRWEWAEHATIESLPALQLIARAARRPQIVVSQHPLIGLGAFQLAQLAELGARGLVMALQMGSGQLIGWFVIEELVPSAAWTLPDGTLLAGSLVIKLIESRTPEGIESPQLAIEGTALGEASVYELPDVSGDPDEVPISEIVRS